MTVYLLMFCFFGLIVGYRIRKAQEPRKIVMVFARMMEAKLRLRDDRGDWRDCGAWRRLCEEVRELELSIGDSDRVDESVDVAITSMQFADHIARLCEHDGRGRSIYVWSK